MSQTPRAIPLLDVNRGHQSLRDEYLQAFAEVFDSGRFLHGDPVRSLEAEIAGRCNVAHGIGCASGSDALLLSLMALEIGPGDEVIAPSFTFFATVSAIWRLGATPVFADIDAETFNLDPQAVESALSSRTRALIPVHLFGQSAEMSSLTKIAEKHGLPVIEDAAQAIGARYNDRPVGSLGDVACFSFYPTKNLGGFGDGGMLVTGDSELAERLRLFASHGMHQRYYHRVVGINSRLDTLQAAALRVKLARLDEYTAARRANAERYHALFAEAELEDHLQLPTETTGFHVWNQYTVRILAGRRDEVHKALAERGVGTAIYYPVPLHLQECFAKLGWKPGSLPATEQACSQVLSLPIFPELTADEQTRVVSALRDVLHASQVAAA